MFKNTMPFISENNKGKHQLNIGTQVPSDAVNLAYYYSPPLDSQENVIIGDNSSFILENINQPQEIIAYINELNKLEGTSQNIDSELIELTDKFKGDIPLYYAYKLKYLHYDRSSNLSGEYVGESISLLDIYNKPLPSSYVYKVVLEKAIPPNNDEATLKKYNNLYEATIYTSFQIEDNFQIKVIYNAISDDTDDSINIIPNFEEHINPQVFFERVDNVLDAVTQKNKYYMQKSPEQIKSSFVYTSGVFDDPRQPQELSIQLKVKYADIEKTEIPALTLTISNLSLLNRDSAINDELKSFIGSKQKLVDKTVREIINDSGILGPNQDLLENQKIISVNVKITDIDRCRESVTIYTRPDGEGCVLAQTSIDTGKITNVPDKFFKKSSNKILTGYGVKFKDRKPIKILKPRGRFVLDNWYVRIQNGKFIKQDGDKTLHYFIPEYYRQHFDKSHGFPYKGIIKEKPIVIGTKSIKVINTPLSVKVDEKGMPTNLSVYRMDSYGNKWAINITNWNNKDGIINLTNHISENDDIYVDYIFEETSYVYKGFLQQDYRMLKHHIYLDCNPNKHHLMTTSMSDNQTLDIPSFNLINKTIYIYMRPAIIQTNASKTYNSEVLYHSLHEIPEEVLENDKSILIGKIFVRPNSSFTSLQNIDTRSRGGGLIEDIDDKLRKELEPESDYYWDIGYWDGEAYSENAVIVVRLDKKILKDFGGRFTKEEVEVSVNKHLAYGSLALIEYVSTFTDDDFAINNVKINVEPINKLDYKPTGMLRVELNNDTSLLSLSVFDDEVKPSVNTFDIGVDKVIDKPYMLKPRYNLKQPFVIDIGSTFKEPIAELVDINAPTIFERFNPQIALLKDTSYIDEQPSGILNTSEDLKLKYKPKFVNITLEGEDTNEKN